MTDARFGSTQLDVVVTGMNPDVRFGGVQLDVVVPFNTEARVGGLQVDVVSVPPAPPVYLGGLQVDVVYVYGGPPAAASRPKLRTVGSTRAVQMKWPDSQWRDVEAMP